MARKLPWTGSDSPAPSRTPTSRVTAPIIKSERRQAVDRPTTPEPTPLRNRKRASSRSPSSSPIKLPAKPIPLIKPMQEGPHADDRYMMVEDEFEDIAKQFTAHLHAAEYARLKAKARSAPAKVLPPLSPSMSRTTKINMERKHLLSRQNTALSGLGRNTGLAGGDNDEDEVDTSQVWKGTSLAGLMDEGSQLKTSLVGLDRAGGATRAARGYGRGDTESTPTKKQKTIKDLLEETTSSNDYRLGFNAKMKRSGHAVRDEDDSDAQEPSKNNTKRTLVPSTSTSVSTTRMGTGTGIARFDTLERSDHNRNHTTSRQSNTTQESRKSTIQPKQEPHSPSTSRTTNNPYKPSSWRSRIDILDDSDDNVMLPPPPLRGTSSRNTSSRATMSPSSKRKLDAKKDRKSRLDEVPVFLF